LVFRGSFPAYKIFAGCAETLGGLLLILPRTATLGALVCLADLTQVFVLNMMYAVPVKLFSFHLILFAVFLLAPGARRLVNFFLADVVLFHAPPSRLFSRHCALIVSLSLCSCCFGAYLVGMNVYGRIQN
jgi:hypothetical protein